MGDRRIQDKGITEFAVRKVFFIVNFVVVEKNTSYLRHCSKGSLYRL